MKHVNAQIVFWKGGGGPDRHDPSEREHHQLDPDEKRGCRGGGGGPDRLDLSERECHRLDPGEKRGCLDQIRR